MKNKNIIMVVAVVVLLGIVAYGVNKYIERKNAEKILNQVFDMQNQIITQGTDTADKFLNGTVNFYNDMLQEQEKETENEEQQIIEKSENQKQEIMEDFKNKEQEMLQDVQNKQKEMIQNGGSSQQQQMLQGVQKMQQQMLQIMQ